MKVSLLSNKRKTMVTPKLKLKLVPRQRLSKPLRWSKGQKWNAKKKRKEKLRKSASSNRRKKRRDRELKWKDSSRRR